MPVLDTHTVETPEGVDFTLSLGGIGSRFFATVIDLILMVLLLTITETALGIVINMTGISGALANTLLIILAFVVVWGYHPLFETWFRGRTVGHLVFGLRVTRLDGGRLGPFAAITRGLFWPIEVLAFPPIAMVSVFATPNNQRLGDLAAGTIVIYDERVATTPRATLQPAAYDPNAPFHSWDVSRISPADTAVLRAFVERRTRIKPAARIQVAQELAGRVRPLVTGAPESWHDEALLEGIVAAKALRD